MPEDENTQQSSSPWNKVFWLFVILIAAALIVYGSFIWIAKHSIDSGKQTITDIVTAFKPDEVVETFIEFREMESKATRGNILEVSTATATEKFTRKTSLEMFGKKMPLGTTVSEISVPATYRYHIDLLGEWFLTTDDNRLLVLAPPVNPSLPVAFDTGKMEKKTEAGWARWDAEENLAELEKTVTAGLGSRAKSEKALAKVREDSRVAVAKFVKTWLMTREGWGPEKFEEIVVRFSDEKREESLSNQVATLRIARELETPGTQQKLEPSSD